MKGKLKFLVFGFSLSVIFLWPFVGFVRVVEDHDAESGWGVFIKSSPSLQLVFKNPAQDVLDIVPFEKLTYEKQEEMRNFCKIRYGLGIKECYRLIW